MPDHDQVVAKRPVRYIQISPMHRGRRSGSGGSFSRIWVEVQEARFFGAAGQVVVRQPSGADLEQIAPRN
jgi:hypothetical protein